MLLISRAFQQRTAACYDRFWVLKPKQWAESCQTGVNYYEWTHSYTSSHNPKVRINVGKVHFYKTTDKLTCFLAQLKNVVLWQCCFYTLVRFRQKKKKHLVRVRTTFSFGLKYLFVPSNTAWDAGLHVRYIVFSHNGFFITPLEAQTRITIALLTRKSGNKHVMWTWNDTFCRNVKMVSTSWHVQYKWKDDSHFN